MPRLRRIVLATVAASMVLLCGVSWAVLLAEHRTLRQLTGGAIDAAAAPSVKMRQALDFLHREVPIEYHDSYFLLPIFRPLKPTALQVVRHGGDCAWRARAMIVILGLYDVQAGKLALHDADGKPVHAVARVETERGAYIVDVLHDFIYEDDEGAPIPLAALGDREVVRQATQRAARNGHELAAIYPVDLYVFDDVRTINWSKNRLTLGLRAALEVVLGRERVDRLPRTRLAAEPALAVMAVAAVVALLSASLLGYDLRRARRSA